MLRLNDHETLDLLGVGLVCLECLRAYAILLEFFRDGFGLVGGHGITHGNVCALSCKLLGNGGADTARAPCDERDLAGQRLSIGGGVAWICSPPC